MNAMSGIQSVERRLINRGGRISCLPNRESSGSASSISCSGFTLVSLSLEPQKQRATWILFCQFQAGFSIFIFSTLGNKIYSK